MVGGGIAGLVASILLVRRGYQVTLLEREAELGGLLRSFRTQEGVAFDYGTHIPAETGIKPLDNILFEGFEEKDWEQFKILKPANFFEGKLYELNQMLYAPNLPQDLFYKGVYELLHTRPFDLPVENLEVFSRKKFGDTFTEHIFKPLINKLLGVAMEDLHQDTLHLFGYERVVIGDEFASRELKQSEFYSSKISYSSFNEGVSRVMKYYPRHKRGVGLWMELLEKQAQGLGVTIIKNAIISNVRLQHGDVTAICLQGGEEVATDHVIWTISPHILTKMLYPSVRTEMPNFRFMTLHHFVIDRPFLTKNFFVYCNDWRYKSFRITLYPNITNEEVKPPYNCTVEVLSDPVSNTDRLNSEILDELKAMGIVNPVSEVLFRKVQTIKNGFPVYTNDFVEQLVKMNAFIRSRVDNITLVGKGSGSAFFMNDVLIEVYEELEKITKE